MDNVSFSFSAEEMNIIQAALGRMPYDDVVFVLDKISDTISSHIWGKALPIPAVSKPAVKRRPKKKTPKFVLTPDKVKQMKEAGVWDDPEKAKEVVAEAIKAPYGYKADGTPKKAPGRPKKVA
jgi:hypothetical protein